VSASGYPSAVGSLPVTPYLDDICASLKLSPSHFLVLTAETAAGKSTAVPLALLKHFSGKIFMLEPRRLAALAVASRVSDLLGEETGGTAGYIMHMESRLSARTRFTVMTEAVLTRMLQDDPSLDGVSVVVVDEFHERSVHADLALAFLKESMQLRDNLYVIVMSATIETERLAAYLGTEKDKAPVYSVPGRQFPVSVEYAGNIAPSDAVMRELRKTGSDASGSILVFLPGIGDIRRTAAELAGYTADADILLLHSSIDFSRQKNILTPPLPSARRRVILSSAIAETSLTVPGITVVIDSGLARVNRMNIAAGMETLSTENESVFSAAQRRGRAGRTGPGRCVCLWNENDARTAEMPPEILRTDLTPLVLESAQWGVYSPSGLSWLDCPSDASWNSARALLGQLGCIQQERNAPDSWRITPLGKAALALGIHPRLACTIFAGLCDRAPGKMDGGTVSGGVPVSPSLRESIRCALRYSRYADAAPSQQQRFCSDVEQRVKKCAASFPGFYRTQSGALCSSADGEAAEDSASLSVTTRALLAGFPDRIAHLHDISGVYQFPSGRLASLPASERRSTSSFPEWIAAPEADAGEREGRIYKYEVIPSGEAELWLARHATVHTETEFAGGPHKLRKTEYVCFGKIVLSSKKINPEPADFAGAVCSSVERNGIEWLPLSDRTKDFLLRAQFYEEHSSADHAKSEADALRLSVREWLIPFLTGTTVTEDSVYEALCYYLDGRTVDKNVPVRIDMPNGKSYRLTYEASVQTASSGKNGDVLRSVRPVLEIIIQRMFGCFETPLVMGVPVLLRLLSPAGRPLQITDDLAGFWKNTWPEICKEMKGRYPKHNWDYRTAEE
jgi:ATP-dependent helicase HrpB